MRSPTWRGWRFSRRNSRSVAFLVVLLFVLRLSHVFIALD
jgi:hypothetical protein